MNNQNIKSLTRPEINKMKEYSPGKPIWEVQQELGIQEVVKLSSNENSLGVSPLAKKAIAKYTSELHRYPDANTTNLREAISSHYDIHNDQVVIGNGADELITLISETFLEAGDEIIVPSPSFSEYEFGANLMGANIVRVPLTNHFHYDLRLIINTITDKTKIIYLCSPNNPTGTYIKKDDLDTFFQKLPQNVLVVFDGAYSQYATSEDYSNGIEYVKSGKQLIIIQTFSKIYGLAGIRVGFGISSSEIINCIHKVREPFNVNTLAQVAAEAAINDIKHVDDSRRVNEEGRNYLYNAFREMGITYVKTMSNFILVDFKVDSLSIYEQLLKKGIIVRYGGVWGLPNYLRVTIGMEAENRALITALKEIIE
ncbi:histidinol-phosphate transaminase [Bacillus spongiae]|uniref:Histidinol-phosphate aminotransferase n=1 Tax=Bacillus spongiae TaxID=2683610 RepID=A0ABU8H8G9_9BACI